MNGTTDWPRVARWAVAVCIVAASIGTPLVTTDTGGAVAMLMAATAFWLLKPKARREQKRQIEAKGLLADMRRQKRKGAYGIR